MKFAPFNNVEIANIRQYQKESSNPLKCSECGLVYFIDSNGLFCGRKECGYNYYVLDYIADGSWKIHHRPYEWINNTDLVRT